MKSVGLADVYGTLTVSFEQYFPFMCSTLVKHYTLRIYDFNG